MTAEAPPTLDVPTIRQLLALDDDQSFVQEVFDTFFDDASLHLKRLRGGAEERRAAAHTLKGSAKQVGATKVAHICLQLEAAEESDVDGLVATLDEALAETRTAAAQTVEQLRTQA